MRCLMLLCLLFSCLPSLALDRSRVEGYLLPNGLQVILKSGYERDHVAIRLVVGVGLDDFDCDQRELPHVLEHLLFSGLDDAGEGGLEARMQALGGEWNAFTGAADTTFVIEAPARNQRKVLDLLLSVVRDTRPDGQDLSNAKRIIEHENGGHYGHLQRWLDRQDVGQPASEQLATELGLRCPARSDVQSITLEQVEALRAHWYAANNMTLIVVGGLDRFLPAYLERTYGELLPVEPGERRDLNGISHRAERRRDLIRGWVGDTAAVQWSFIEPVLDTDHDKTLELLARYLDWVQYDALRLRHGLAYGPSVRRESQGDSGLLTLNAVVSRDDVSATLDALQKALDDLRQTGLNPALFARIQAAAISREAWTTQGNSALADYYWSALNGYADGRFDDPARQLKAVTLRQANAALQALLADQGYVRVSKPLMSQNGVYTSLATAGLTVLVLPLVYVLRRTRARAHEGERP